MAEDESPEQETVTEVKDTGKIFSSTVVKDLLQLNIQVRLFKSTVVEDNSNLLELKIQVRLFRSTAVKDTGKIIKIYCI